MTAATLVVVIGVYTNHPIKANCANQPGPETVQSRTSFEGPLLTGRKASNLTPLCRARPPGGPVMIRTAAVWLVLLVSRPNAASAQAKAAGEYSKHFNALSGLSVAVAQAMPPEQYAFRPHPESMSFGELISHIATTNYQSCAGLKDAAPPCIAFTHRQGRHRKVPGRFLRLLRFRNPKSHRRSAQ